MEEINYVYILDFCSGGIRIIHLTPDDVKKSKEYDDFEEYLSTLEEKYDFRLSNCNWMTSKNLIITHYCGGKEITKI